MSNSQPDCRHVHSVPSVALFFAEHVMKAVPVFAKMFYYTSQNLQELTWLYAAQLAFAHYVAGATQNS